MSEQPGADKIQRRTRAALSPVAHKLWSIRREGYDRLPEAGPAIICPNHISFIDSVFLMLTMPRNISFVGKAEYMDDWKTRFVFPALGMIPIDRSGGSKSEGALLAAEAVLARGELFGIYPEGTRSRDGLLYKGRTGAARLALATGAPVYPVGIIGTDTIQPVDSFVPKLRREAMIRVGRPIRPERYLNRGPEHLAWRSMTDEIMFEIRELSGQTYCDHYAGEQPDRQVSRVASVTDEPSDGPAGTERELVSA